MRRDLHKLLLQKETVMMVTSRISPSPLDEADLKKKAAVFQYLKDTPFSVKGTVCV